MRRPRKSKYVNKGEVVGVIGDTHIPYELPEYLPFCKRIFREQGVNRVIHIGDLIDHHALSFHESEPCLQGARGERILATERLRPWFEAFPGLKLIMGNHDKIPPRQLKRIGLDAQVWMRPLAEVYGFPDGWKTVDKVFSNGVLYHHGETALGANGFRNDAQSRMTSTVTGHAHGNSGVSYTATDHRLVFGCAVGCGVDAKSMAFAYGKNFKHKPIISCAVILDDGKLPVVFPMDRGERL